MELIRTDSLNKDFIMLVEALDKYLAFIDGDEHAFYAQFNKTNLLKNAVVAYENNFPAGCGALKVNDAGDIEVKRMYVMPEFRGKGIATVVLHELEKWAAEMNFTKCVLETGDRQPEAVALYKKNSYRIIPNFGQYKDVKNSICFQKDL